METATEIQNERKRKFFIFCTWLMILTVLLLAGIDLNEEDIKEFFVDLVILAVLFSGLLLIRLTRKVQVVIRSIIFLICLLLYYNVSIEAGEGTVFFWLFFMPPLFFYFFGKKEGLIWGALFVAGNGILMWLFPVFTGHTYDSVVMSRLLIALPVVTIVCFGLESSRDFFSRLLDQRNQQLEEEKAQLEKALKEIKTLSGLIPICARCKSIRNDEGFWERVETYIEARSEADFTHGLCPECTKQLYPNLKIKKKTDPKS